MDESDDERRENDFPFRIEEEIDDDDSDDEMDDANEEDVRPLTLNLGDLSGKASEGNRRGSLGVSLSTRKRKVKLIKDTVIRFPLTCLFPTPF